MTDNAFDLHPLAVDLLQLVSAASEVLDERRIAYYMAELKEIATCGEWGEAFFQRIERLVDELERDQREARARLSKKPTHTAPTTLQ